MSFSCPLPKAQKFPSLHSDCDTHNAHHVYAHHVYAHHAHAHHAYVHHASNFTVTVSPTIVESCTITFEVKQLKVSQVAFNSS